MRSKTFIAKYYFNTLFFLYGLSIVLFDNAKYLNIIYFINLLLGISFLYFVLMGEIKMYINLFFKIYFIFAVFAIASSFWSSDFFYTARKSLTLVLIFLNLFFIYNINKKYDNYKFLIYGIFIALYVNFLWFIDIIDLGLTYDGWRFQGSVLQSNNFVFILMFGMMMMIFLISANRVKMIIKLFLIPLFFMIIFMIFFTASKAGMIGALFLVFLLAFQSIKLKNSIYILLGALLIYVIVVFTPLLNFIFENTTLDLEYSFKNIEKRIRFFILSVESGSSVSNSTRLRVQMVNNAIDLWAYRPIFGNGMAAFEILYGGYSHNNIVELLSSFGLFGLVLYYSIYVYLFFEIRKISSKKIKIMLIVFLFLFLLFDQSIVSYNGKFKILSLLIILLIVQDQPRNESIMQKMTDK